MNERKKAMQESLVQATSGASCSGLRSPEQGGKHTPTPWMMQAADHNTGEFLFWIEGDDQNINVCNFYYRSLDGLWVENTNAEANAARIVQCVNSHDDLVAALEAFIGEWVELAISGDAGFWDPEKDAVVINARAALLKAKGGA